MSGPIGQLVEYIDKSRMILGLVQDIKKNRLALLITTDRQVVLPQNRVLLMTQPEFGVNQARDALVRNLRETLESRNQLAEKVDVEELWELVYEEDNPLPLKDLAELSFGPSPTSDQLSATLRALFEQRVHFRLSGGDFVPLSAKQLELKLDQMEKEALHKAEVDDAVDYLKSLPKTGSTEGWPPAPNGILELLRDFIVFEEEAGQAKKAKEIIALAEIGGRRKLFNLLVRLGVFKKDEDLLILKEGLPVEFSEDVLDNGRDLNPLAAPDNHREDLTGLFTFTIDGAFTTDFDDALSFEPNQDGSGGTLGVHITDAQALIKPGSLLDQEAKERGSTIYLPETRIPMMPPSLSEDLLSLRQGELRPCVSTFADLDAQGRVLSYRICQSFIQVDKRLTYNEADLLLETDPRLKAMARTCDALRQQRAWDGAYFLPLPELVINVDEDGLVEVQRLDRDGPSREMVAETAILANQLGARYLLENKLPALFRTQAPPKDPLEEGPVEDLFLHFRQRRLLNRMEISTEPGMHSSLGVEPYTHSTSPIRRYLDLVMQRQITSGLQGQGPAYSTDELENLVMQVMPAVRLGNKIRTARQRYWLLRWLEQRRDQPIEAMAIENQGRRWQILLTRIMLLTSVPNTGNIQLNPGQELTINIEKVNAFEDILRISLN